jgi:CBS domain-containing protein
MARTVSEVMNRELVLAQEGVSTEAIRDLVLAMGITAVPVLDGDRRPTGVLSLRDLLGVDAGNARPSRPAVTVSEKATLEEAARALARTDYHTWW